MTTKQNLEEQIQLFLAEIRTLPETAEVNYRGDHILLIVKACMSFQSTIKMLEALLKLYHKYELKYFVKIDYMELWRQNHLEMQIVRDPELTAFHLERLKKHFHPEITKEKAQESFGYLFGKGWTNSDLSKRLDISKVIVSRFRNGEERELRSRVDAQADASSLPLCQSLQVKCGGE